MIGARVHHAGVTWAVVDWLDDPPSVVLQALDQSVIQSNRHGESHRRVPATWTVPADPAHPVIRELLSATR